MKGKTHDIKAGISEGKKDREFMLSIDWESMGEDQTSPLQPLCSPQPLLLETGGGLLGGSRMEQDPENQETGVV